MCCLLTQHRDLFLLDEVVSRAIRPLLLLDGGGCRGNMDRSGDRSGHRGGWTRCDSCASTWLCLHCGDRKANARERFISVNTFKFVVCIWEKWCILCLWKKLHHSFFVLLVSVPKLCTKLTEWKKLVGNKRGEEWEKSGWSGDEPLSPCARGRAREGDTWLAGLGEAPAPAAPGVVEEEEEEEGVLETGPLDTTITQKKTHTHTHRMDQWPIRQIGLTVRWNMRGEEDDVLHRERGESMGSLTICLK